MKPLDSTLSTCNIIDWIWCQLHLPNLHGYPTNKLSCSDKWLMQQPVQVFLLQKQTGLQDTLDLADRHCMELAS